MTTSNTQNSTAPQYFDLVTHARLFPNFARTIPVKGGNDYERVNGGAAFGEVGENTLEYVNYDLKVVAGQTLTDYLSVKDAINDKNQKVRMQVIIGDGKPEIQEYKDKQYVVLKGRLLKIIWCSVDGKLVIDNRQKDGEAAAEKSVDQVNETEAEEGEMPADAKVEDRVVD